LGINIVGYVKEINGIKAKEIEGLSVQERFDISDASPVRVLDPDVEQQMMDRIDEAKQEGDSIGGVCEVYVEGMPAGIGSYVHDDQKLDAKIAGSVMSSNAFKGPETGVDVQAARLNGSELHDAIISKEETGYSRRTNNL